MNYLEQAFSNIQGLDSLCEALSQSQGPVLATGLCDSVHALFCAELIRKTGKKLLIIVPDEKAASKLYSELSGFISNTSVFQTRDLNLSGFEAESRDFDHRRLQVLTSALSGSYGAIIAPAEAACQQTIPKKCLNERLIRLSVGDEVDAEVLIECISALGYIRADKVEGAGQFSVRGGIVDIFVPTEERPIRIEFFGDEIDSLSPFDIMTQRREEPRQEAFITPAQEISFGVSEREKVIDKLRRELKKTSADNPEKLAFITAELERAENGMAIASDLYYDAVYRRETLFDYCTDALSVIIDCDNVRLRLDAARSLANEHIKSLFEQNKTALPSKESEPICSFERMCGYVSSKPTVVIESLSSGRCAISPVAVFGFRTRTAPTLVPDMDYIAETVGDYLEGGFTISIICENSMETVHLYESLTDRNIPAVIADINTEIPLGGKNGAVYITSAMKGDSRQVTLRESYELIDARFCFLTTAAAEKRTAAAKKRPSPRKQSSREKIVSYSDLRIGDYVVHAAYGIGIYQGIEKIARDGVFKDFIKIKYAGSDVLYVPCSNLDNVSKYIGGKSDSPNLKLNHIGGGDWQKTKSRAKRAASDIAKQLISLYSDRMNCKSFAFSPDTEWQKEFEGSFEYAETDGQLRATEDIKRDMEKPCPMDRLLCGDVGFGKTEVALRGIFKCVMDSKQAAVLVPTTILAWQHYQTILTRFRGYPVKVEMLSRFRTKKEQTEVIKKLKSGEVDIVVGTHRLLQNDIAFHDLGFLVIDEEQRFGVTHKEKLKTLSRGVDVLTLTATPIPRTLSMALGGIRDMSILEEAPEDRFPVQTYVFPFDKAMIIEAVRKELRRAGQVFYLCNKIEKLPARAAMIRESFPDAVVETAHGKLEKEALSDIWRDMMDAKIDVLVCTTIIETGIDLPNANTLIIEDADCFGLSQLHQIRGRVGRSDRKAYAYLTYRPGKVLNEISVKRLKAIREYTEFGSGFKIAMRDLEIRGAGNLLGAEQHGHLDSVGYDLYMKLLNDAVLEQKGEISPDAEKTECFIDLTVNAFIPESYIESSEMRIDIYKKIAAVENREDESDLTDELIDRFGDIPVPVQNLIDISRLKHLAESLAVTRISQKDANIIFSIAALDLNSVSLMGEVYGRDFFFAVSPKPSMTLKMREKINPVEKSEEFLTHYKGFTERA